MSGDNWSVAKPTWRNTEGHKAEGAYATLFTESIDTLIMDHDESVNINTMPTRQAWMSYASSRLVTLRTPLILSLASELPNL